MKTKQIKDLPEYYITDTGDIYSRTAHNRYRIKKLKPYKTGCKNGQYLTVRIAKKLKKIHHLVAQTFIPNPENKPYINHKNGNKLDNRVDNLEWATHSENITHSYHVLGHKSPIYKKYGKEYKGVRIIQQIKKGKVIAEFYGSGEVYRKTGVNKSNVLSCCKGIRKTASGYEWKYKGV